MQWVLFSIYITLRLNTNFVPYNFSDLEAKLNQAELPPNVQKVVKKELKRIKKMSQQSPEYPMLRHYLELIADLPWNKATKDNIDISKAREVSNTIHTFIYKKYFSVYTHYWVNISIHKCSCYAYLIYWFDMYSQ